MANKEMTVKTTLVPGAPWPPKDAKVTAKPKIEKPKTDINFESWVKKQKEQIDLSKILGKG
jgi:hypothetical protein